MAASVSLLDATLMSGAVAQVRTSYGELILGDAVTRKVGADLFQSQGELAEALTLSEAERTERVSTQALADEDDIHDQLLHTVFHALSGTIALGLARRPPDEADIALVESIMAEVLPDGLIQVNKSYLKEATEAEIHLDNLSALQWSRIERISVGDEPLKDVLEQYRASGARLASLLQRRASSSAVGDLDLTVGELRRTVGGHVRRLTLLLPESDLSGAQQAAIMGILEDAVAAQARRNAARKASAAAGEAMGAEDNGAAASVGAA